MKRACKSWLDTYLNYTEFQESPEAFHRWVSISVVASAIGRKAYIDRGYYTLYPNLYIILVGESARLRKSVATSIGVKLLKKIKTPPTIFAQKLTQESLIQTLAGLTAKHLPAAALAYAPELAVFLGTFQTNSGLVSALTTLYDSPDSFEYRTVSRGMDMVKYICLNLLGASTADWMRLAIPEDAIGGGFTSRITFVCQEKQARIIAFPDFTDEIREMQRRLVHDLTIISELEGPVVLTDDARTWFESWYLSHDPGEGSPLLKGYRGRKHDLLLKISMIRSMSISDDMYVTPDHLMWAMDQLENVEGDMALALEDLHISQMGREIKKVLDIIRKKETITHTALMRQCWRFADTDGLERIVRTLEVAGFIKMLVTDRMRKYKAIRSK